MKVLTSVACLYYKEIVKCPPKESTFLGDGSPTIFSSSLPSIVVLLWLIAASKTSERKERNSGHYVPSSRHNLEGHILCSDQYVLWW